MHAFSFLVETYATERIKTLTVWSEFAEAHMGLRPAPLARTAHEQFVHQHVSEDGWFRTMLGIETDKPVLPTAETRLGFLEHYADTSAQRLTALQQMPADWFEGMTTFFGEPRSRAWVLTRRIAHTAHHRGQLTLLLRLLDQRLYSTYGPTADTGGLPKHDAPVIYRYRSVPELLVAEAAGGHRPPLPGPGEHSATERP